jgi:hypothetical protein
MKETDQIFLIWPELENYRNKIYQLFPGQGNNFSHTPTNQIIDEILEAYRLGKTKFVFSNLGESYIPYFLIKLNDVIEKIDNNLVSSNDVFYATGTVNGDAVYQTFADKHNWTKRFHILAANFCQFSSIYNWRNFQEFKDYEVRTKEKIFVCLNRVHRLHRIKLFERALMENLLESSYYSFEGNGKDISWVDTVAFPFDISNIKKNKHILPLRLNITEDRINPVDLINDDVRYHDNSYFSVITETLFYQDHWIKEGLLITEKTYRAIALKHPFVILGNPGFLKALRQWGFKTFAPFIDESYDNIEDDDARFECVVQEIKRLTEFDNDRWLDWQKSIKEIVEFNHTHMYSLTDHRVTKDIENYFK